MATNRVCAVCHERGYDHWAWQPFGPDDGALCFTLAGSHYRGFPVIYVCNRCKGVLERNPSAHAITFDYQHVRYALVNGKVLRAKELLRQLLDK